MSEFSNITKEAFATPEKWNIEIPVHDSGGQHNAILKNYADAILDGAPLIAPAEEGIHSVELANAMLMSAFLDKTIEMPLDAAAYEVLLQQKIAGSKLKKVVVPIADNSGFASSFNPA